MERGKVDDLTDLWVKAGALEDGGGMVANSRAVAGGTGIFPGDVR